MAREGMKKSPVFKLFSAFLSITFFLSNISFAAIDANIGAPEIEKSGEPVSVEDIGIAIDTGTIKNKYAGTSGKTIIHIQDAHCNFEAQSNINKILEQVTKECGVDMISVEGAEGLVDTAWFRAFPDAEIRREVATYFMKKGEITGAEFFSINSDEYKGTIFGAETKDYYIKNLKAFTDVYPYTDTIEKYFTDLKDVTNRIKSLIYTPKLKELDLKIRAFQTKELELSDYGEYLNKVMAAQGSEMAAFPNFGKLIQTLEYEHKIDFDIVDAERSKYIDLLGKKMPKEGMAELVTQSIKFKKGHIKAVDFYTYLRDLAREYEIDIVKEYPNLFYYNLYTKLYDGIDNEKLFKELDAIETLLKKKFFQNEEQETLDKYSDMVSMYVDLIKIELTNEDYAKFKTYQSEFSMDDVLSFIGKLSERYSLNYTIDRLPGDIGERLPNMVDFYEIAMKRDQALIDNTIKRMEAEGKDRCVLIAGGFHTKGIESLLEDKGVSYLVVTPKITKDVDTPYIKVLTNQRTSLEDIIMDSAAMPGVSSKKSREAQTSQNDEFLSPLLRFAYTVNLLFDAEGEKALHALSEEIKIPGGPTLEETTVQTFEETIRLLTTKWLEKVRGRMAEEFGVTSGGVNEEWNKFVGDDILWKTLKSVYVGKYDETFQVRNTQGVPSPEVKNRISAIFDEFRELERGNSPGEFATGITTGIPLTAEEFSSYDSDILRKGFDEGQVVTEKAAKADEVTVYVHKGLEERISDENDLRVNQGIKLIPLARDHPGTYRGRKNQLHVSDYIWNHRDVAPYRDIIKNHEQVHLDIYNAEVMAKEKGAARKHLVSKRAERHWTLWNAYVAYQKKTNKPIDQEDFVDRLKVFWAKELGASPADFKDADTREYRRIAARLQGERVFENAEKALLEMNQTGLRKALVEAYILAETYKYDQPFKDILNFFGVVDPKKRSLANGVFNFLGENFNLWLNKNLFENISDAAEGFVLENFERTVNKGVQPQDVVAVIMAGGGGERLSPLSTVDDPKQVTESLLGTPLIRIAVERVIGNLGAENIYVQTVPHLKPKIFSVLKDLGIKEENIFAEPKAADTAGAIGYAAAKLKQRGLGDKVMFVGTADHYIDTASDAFQTTYMDAAKVVKNTSSIGTIGIDPEKIGPSEEYGCIAKGYSTFFGKEGAVVAETFIEKPKGQKAIDIFNDRLEDNSHKWLYNSGMFLGRPDVFLRAFDEVAPYYGRRLKAIADAREEESENIEKAVFEDFAEKKKEKGFPHTGEPSGKRSGVSVDYVLAQPLSKSRSETNRVGLFMIPGEFNWKDIGGYKAVYEYYRDIEKIADENQNVIVGPQANNIILENSSNNLVIARDNDVKISLKGINNSVIAYNPKTKAVIVAPLDIKGDTIKLLIDKFNAKKALKGYVSGKVNEITPSVRVLSEEKRLENDNVIREEKTGYGMILGARSSAVHVKAGFAAILEDGNLEGTGRERYKNIFMLVNPQEGNSSLSVEVEYMEEGGLVKDNVIGGGLYRGKATREERIKSIIRMLYNGELNAVPSADEYRNTFGLSDFLGLSEEEVEEEVRAIKERYERFEALRKKFPIPKFGTSGLRGKNSELVDMIVYSVVKAGLKYFKDLPNMTKDDIPSEYLDFIKAGGLKPGDKIPLAGDLRPTTERMLIASAAAILDENYGIDFGGWVPTPTITYAGLLNKVISIMVTGSHIPIDENGLKFNRANGEVWKVEEKMMIKYVTEALMEEFMKSPEESLFDENGYMKKNTASYKEAESAVSDESINPEIPKKYEERFTDALGKPLEGIKALFWQHSAVGRDLVPDILRKLGAEIETVDRRGMTAEEFLTLDTEDVGDEHFVMVKNLMDEYGMDVLITPGGDSDRPAVFCRRSPEDEVVYITGDKLGILATLFLSPEFFALPDTATEAPLRKLSAEGIEVMTTDVGSPFVDEAMYGYLEGLNATGCEVNGGFFIGANGLTLPKEAIEWLKSINKGDKTPTGYFKGLSTRDALTPIVSVLLLAKKMATEGMENAPVSELLDDLVMTAFSGEFAGERAAGLIDNGKKVTPGAENYTPEIGKGIMTRYRPSNKDISEVFFEESGEIYYTLKGDKTAAKIKAYPNLAAEMQAIEKELVGKFLRQIPGLEDEEKARTVRIGYKTSGVKVVFSNGEIVMPRPSGNSAQFRMYAQAATKERAKAIVAEGIRENDGILIQMVEAYRKTKPADGKKMDFGDVARTSPGAYAVTPFGGLSPWEQILERAKESRLFKEMTPEILAALKQLGTIIKSGDRLSIKYYFKLGSDGYKWGVPFIEADESAILEFIGARSADEKYRIIRNNLSTKQVNNFGAAYTGPKNDFETWLKETIMKDVVAERWIAAGEIAVNNVILPLGVLSFWGEEIFGAKYVDEYGAQSDITAKYLTSLVPLSAQYHRFSEMIIPLKDGYAYIGLTDAFKGMTPEERQQKFIEALKTGDISILKKVPLKAGVPMVVPAYVPHAYGAGTRVYEAKAVSSAKDAVGTVSWYDRLKWEEHLDAEKRADAERMLEEYLKTKDKTIRDSMIKKGYFRDGKDILTFDDAKNAAIAKEIDDHGFLEEIDVNTLLFAPQRIFGGDEANVDLMGDVAAGFRTYRYQISEGKSVDEAKLPFAEMYHSLFVSEGEVVVKTSKGKEFTLKKGNEFLVYAGMGTYNIESRAGQATVFTQYKPMPDDTYVVPLPFSHGEKVVEDKYASSVTGVIQKWGDLPQVGEYVELNGQSVEPPQIIGNRTHTITVRRGVLEIVSDGEKVAKFYPGDVVTIADKGISTASGMELNLPVSMKGDLTNYWLVKAPESDGPGVLKVDYDKDQGEDALYSVFRIFKDNPEILNKKEVELIYRMGTFRSGGRKDPGSAKWVEYQINKVLGEERLVRIFEVVDGVTPELMALNFREKAEIVIASSEKDILKAQEKYGSNVEFRGFMSNVRSLGLPDDMTAIQDQGWMYALESAMIGVVQANLTKDMIDDRSTFAIDVAQMMSQITRKNITGRQLYYMLPFNHVPADIREELGVMDAFEFIARVVKALLLNMPMKPFDPAEEIYQRQMVLQSV